MFCGNRLPPQRPQRGDDERTDYLLAIDQGTTSTRAILFDAAGAGPPHRARIELRQIYPRPGWVEHDPEEIWQAVVADLPRGDRRRRTTPRSRRSASPTSARRRCCGSAPTGRPVHNAIVWQDRRTADICERWRADGLAETVARAHRARHRPVFLGLENPLAARQRCRAARARRRRRDRLRHDRQLSVVAADRRHGCTRPTSPTRRARCCSICTGSPGTTSCSPRSASRAALLPEVRDTDADFGSTAAGAVRPADPDRRDRRRPAGGADRPGLLSPRHGQIDLRHRRLRAAAHRRDAGGLAPPAADDDRLSARRRDRLCARRQHLYRRRGGAMAARPARRVIAAAAETQALAERADPRQRVYFVPAFAGLGAPYWAPDGARRADRADRRMRRRRDRARRRSKRSATRPAT